MSLEVALVVSVLGVSFYLIYLASTIEANHWLFVALKIFLTLFSLFGIIINSGLNIHLLSTHNATIAEPTFSALNSALSINMRYIILTFITIMFFFLLYLLCFAIGKMLELVKRRRK